MDTHVRTLGWLNIVFGALSAAVVIGVFAYYGGVRMFYYSIQNDAGAVVLTTSALFHLVIALPCILLGIHIKRYRQWARAGLTAVSALNVLNMPIGSLLGAYGLWVLMTPETEPLFSHPDPHVRSRRSGYEKTDRAKSPADLNRPILRADIGPQ